jgi:hypothetical protein
VIRGHPFALHYLLEWLVHLTTELQMRSLSRRALGLEVVVVEQVVGAGAGAVVAEVMAPVVVEVVVVEEVVVIGAEAAYPQRELRRATASQENHSIGIVARRHRRRRCRRRRRPRGATLRRPRAGVGRKGVATGGAPPARART